MILSRLVRALLLGPLPGTLVFASILFGQATALPTAPTTPPPPQDPKILEDGGFSIEPYYWLTQAQPKLIGGSQATAYGDLAYPGKSRKGLGIELAFPAGRANTLRFSYFKVQGYTNTTLGQDSTIFSQGYQGGDFINANYKIQNAKISWDYLSYTFKNHIRFKTLYEFQYVNISTNINAPLVPETTDPTTGLPTITSSNGSKQVFYPTFGGEFEQPVNKHVRWEIGASGFGWPHSSVIWDAQADVAFRFSSLELALGAKAFHFKTSPKTDEYFTDTLEGAFVAVRYYLSKPTN